MIEFILLALYGWAAMGLLTWIVLLRLFGVHPQDVIISLVLCIVAWLPIIIIYLHIWHYHGRKKERK